MPRILPGSPGDLGAGTEPSEGAAARKPAERSVAATREAPGSGHGPVELTGELRREGGKLFAQSNGVRIVLDEKDAARMLAPRSRSNAVSETSVPPQLLRAIEVAASHRERLMALAGVIAVRGGFLFRDGAIQDEAAIVVSVDPAARVPHGLPPSIENIPVDTTPASPEEMLLFRGRTGGGSETTPVPPVAALLIDQIQSGTDALAVDELSKQITYEPPPGVTLDEVTGAMTVTCHVSPDAGWAVLQPFLESTAESLHLGMYDFTAPHILQSLRSMLRNTDAEFRMTLDRGQSLPSAAERERNPDSTKANDRTEDSIILSLRRVAGDRFSVAFARTGNNNTFASAYHIKVAVRDLQAFWLSSGNWQSSNQPALDFIGGQADPSEVKRYNREWHVVVEHPGLSKTFQKFLEHDFATAQGDEAAPLPPALPDVLVPIDEVLEEEAARVPIRIFPPKRFVFSRSRPLRVQPLLTPDNYAPAVLELLRSARQRVYFQNQSLKPNANPSAEFRSMISLLAEFSHDPDKDVRIIFRNIGDTRKVLESLKASGFNMQRIRMQSGCHTKGIIIDSETVLVGSHNWSDEGVMQNRDASLIFFNADIAAYYEEVFLHDWERLSRPVASNRRGMLEVSESGGRDLVAIPWADWQGES